MRQEYPTEEIPNTDLEAISELEKNGGTLFTGTIKDFFKILIKFNN